jgi:hypothetical protein
VSYQFLRALADNSKQPEKIASGGSACVLARQWNPGKTNNQAWWIATGESSWLRTGGPEQELGEAGASGFGL